MSTTIPDRLDTIGRFVAGRIVPVLLAGVLHAIPPSHAQQYPKHHAVAGGIAIIPLNLDIQKGVQAKFGRTPILMYKHKGSWIGVVGIDLDTGQGNYLISVSIPNQDPTTQEFSVKPYSYPLRSQRENTILPLPFNPPDKWRPELHATFPLLPPVQTKTMVPFGTRYAAGGDQGPETGVVFSVSTSQKVVAPGEGIVFEILKPEEEGWIYVTIDHGMGLFSSLGPINRLLKENGQPVDKGEVLGEVDHDRTAPTGLYWQTALNGAVINPLLFTEAAEETEISD